MKEFGNQKSIIEKMAAMRTLTFFRIVSTKRGYAWSMIVHTRVGQFLPQLLMELFDTLYIYNVNTLNICMNEFGS